MKPYSKHTIERTMYYGAKPKIFQNAKALRDKMTEAEIVLWKRLNNKQLGFRFKSQHPIGQFIADFYCHKAKLVVEVDGSVHDSTEKKEYDEGRTYEMEHLGLKVIRFSNLEVINKTDEVIEIIKLNLPSHTPNQ